MFAQLCSMGLGVHLLLGPCAVNQAGFLLQTKGKACIISYAAREGDLIFFDDHSRVWTALFALAGTGPPLHMGIVVKKPGGGLAILEAGPDDRVKVELLDLAPRLYQFDWDYQGTITIRRCKVALDQKKSAALTRFALAQEGKPYAVLRLLAQGTRFRVRGALEPLLAKTQLNRDAWICSELVVAAGTRVGLFDPRVVKANATYPRDLVNNQRHDLSAQWQDPAEWRPRGKRHQAPALRIAP